MKSSFLSLFRQRQGVESEMPPNCVVGQRIATARDDRYSEALNSVPGTWSEERLDAFLADPQSFAPGTSMQSEGLSDPTSRAKLIEYLKRLK